MLFLLSGFCCWLVEFFIEQRNKCMSIALSFLALLLLTWLCGARDFSIGTDIKVYGYQFFQFAVRSQSLTEYINNIRGFYGDSGIMRL